MNDNKEVKDQTVEEEKESQLEAKEESLDAEILEPQEEKKEESSEHQEENKGPEPMESLVEVKTTYDYKTLKYANMYLIRVKRRSRLIYSIMASISIIAAVLTLLFMEGTQKYLAIVLFALGLWTIYNIFTEEKKIDKSLAKFFSSHEKFYQNVAINNDQIRVTAETDGQERWGDFPWAYIQEIHAIPEYYFLFTQAGNPLIIDRNPEALLKGTTQDLDAIIKEKAVLKPFKTYEKPFVKTLVDIQYYEAKKPETEEEKPEEKKDINE